MLQNWETTGFIISSDKIPDLFYLIGSIVLSTFLTLSFKVLERLQISSFQAIVFNYWACVVTGSLVDGGFPLNSLKAFDYAWLNWSVLLGSTFILLFNIIAYTARNIGVAVASVANKLSMVIPFSFSFVLYRETASGFQLIGILLALVAVILTCYPSAKPGTIKHPSIALVLLVPGLLFVGSGLLDTMIKYVEQRYLNAGNSNQFLISAFFFAALIGSVLTIVQMIRKKLIIDRRAVLAGVMIGVPNYFSIWCLIKVLKQYPGSSSVIIPVNNMGIVLLSAVSALIFFGERLSVLNWTGIALAILAISLIAFAL